MNEQYSAIAERPFFLLPHDCWVDVIEYLAFPDILSMSTTCKSLHATAEPFFCREVTLNWNTDKLALRQVLQLLRIIFARSELASSVQHISLLSLSTVIMQRTESELFKEISLPCCSLYLPAFKSQITSSWLFFYLDGWISRPNGETRTSFAKWIVSNIWLPLSD